jgi:hypothetical protein
VFIRQLTAFAGGGSGQSVASFERLVAFFGAIASAVNRRCRETLGAAGRGEAEAADEQERKQNEGQRSIQELHLGASFLWFCFDG